MMSVDILKSLNSLVLNSLNVTETDSHCNKTSSLGNRTEKSQSLYHIIEYVDYIKLCELYDIVYIAYNNSKCSQFKEKGPNAIRDKSRPYIWIQFRVILTMTSLTYLHEPNEILQTCESNGNFLKSIVQPLWILNFSLSNTLPSSPNPLQKTVSSLSIIKLIPSVLVILGFQIWPMTAIFLVFILAPSLASIHFWVSRPPTSKSLNMKQIMNVADGLEYNLF